MARTYILQRNITLTLDGVTRTGDLHHEPEAAQLWLVQDLDEQREALTPQTQRMNTAPFWGHVRLTREASLTRKPYTLQIGDFNEHAGLAEQLADLDIITVMGEGPLNPEDLHDPLRVIVLRLNPANRRETAAAR